MAENAESPKSTPNLDDVRADVDALRAELSRLLDSLSDTAKTQAKAAAAEAEYAAEQASAWAESRYGSLREVIREQPVTSCVVAAGIGFLLGQILLRR